MFDARMSMFVAYLPLPASLVIAMRPIVEKFKRYPVFLQVIGLSFILYAEYFELALLKKYSNNNLQLFSATFEEWGRQIVDFLLTNGESLDCINEDTVRALAFRTRLSTVSMAQDAINAARLEYARVMQARRVDDDEALDVSGPDDNVEASSAANRAAEPYLKSSLGLGEGANFLVGQLATNPEDRIRFDAACKDNIENTRLMFRKAFWGTEEKPVESWSFLVLLLAFAYDLATYPGGDGLTPKLRHIKPQLCNKSSWLLSHLERKHMATLISWPMHLRGEYSLKYPGRRDIMEPFIKEVFERLEQLFADPQIPGRIYHYCNQD